MSDKHTYTQDKAVGYTVILKDGVEMAPEQIIKELNKAPRPQDSSGSAEFTGSISHIVKAANKVSEVLGSGIYSCPACGEDWLQVKCRFCGGCGVKVEFEDGLK